MQKNKIPELLAPAGNMDKLRTALLYGANAVYLGGKDFNLRASCDGFGKEELATALALASQHSIQIYYCLNSFPHEQNLARLTGIIEECAELGVHGFIIADPGVFRLARRYAPSVPIHVSTQANTTNSESIAFWKEAGATRVNLARELSWRDIKAIQKAAPGLELELFVHGAMCLALSGKCLLSAWLNNRPANEGRCTHPCRFQYKSVDEQGACPNGLVDGAKSYRAIGGSCGGDSGCGDYSDQPRRELYLEEATRPGQTMWIAGGPEPYSPIWSPLDLCLIHYLPWFMARGIDSLKIEGRMKGAAYVAHVVDTYSTALAKMGRIMAQNGNGMDNPERFDPWEYFPELLWTASRPLSSGFFMSGNRVNYSERAEARGQSGIQAPLMARVIEAVNADKTSWQIEICTNWHEGMIVELMLPGLQRPKLIPGSYALENHRGEKHSEVKTGTRSILHDETGLVREGIFIRGV